MDGFLGGMYVSLELYGWRAQEAHARRPAQKTTERGRVANKFWAKYVMGFQICMMSAGCAINHGICVSEAILLLGNYYGGNRNVPGIKLKIKGLGFVC